MASLGSAVQGALRRDRLLVAGALLAVVALAWTYLLLGAGMDMHMGAGMSMDGAAGAIMPMQATDWTPGYAGLVLVMWAIMMMAMMLPSAAPMILLYATIARRRQGQRSAASWWLFAGGYVAVWSAFSVAATALQYGLEALALLSPMMATTSIVLAGVLLVAAGVYQWTPLKQACLRHCRSPLEFVVTRWRDGPAGAFAMGAGHGAYCLGCCWVLMLLLFIGGVMNLMWIAGLALFVLVEKLAPAGHWISRVAGIGLVAWGGATLMAIAG